MKVAFSDRALNVRKDTLDFRDHMYIPTLVEVPAYRALEDYRRAKVPVLDQGKDGACTGFGLATVAHYLLRTHKVTRDATSISPFMFYDLARRYDEWPGENYEGSSCRGAMKGWYKHGVCRETLWPMSHPGAPLGEVRAEDAARRPLGAYFRVNHQSLVAMHSAITEAGVLYASASVHGGWEDTGKDGLIKKSDKILGGHAFAVVAYDADGFWIQNSWSASWGKNGFGHISYDDWLENGSDAWVARLGVPVRLSPGDGATKRVFVGAVRAKSWSYTDLRPHVINIGDHGLLDPHGDIGTTPEMVREIVRNDIPRITTAWKKKRIVLYAHGGLVKQDDALQRVNEYRDAMLEKECYPLAFIWNSDFWTIVKELLSRASAQRRPEGFLDSAKDFMLDRLDDMLEPLARTLGGQDIWTQMKENALAATTGQDGGARQVLIELGMLASADPKIEFHVVGHSAGSIFHAPLLQYLATSGTIQQGPMQGIDGLGRRVETCTMWAPAATTELFRDAYAPLIKSGGIGRFALFQLDDQTEQDDDCAGIYHKSLLYLVSNAFEDRAHIPLIHPEGEPIVGMQKFVDKDRAIKKIFDDGLADRVIAPTSGLPVGNPNASGAKHHVDFDDDKVTVLATLARILGSTRAAASSDIEIKVGATSKRETRRRIDKMPDFALTR
jgi:hypothetical protein